MNNSIKKEVFEQKKNPYEFMDELRVEINKKKAELLIEAAEFAHVETITAITGITVVDQDDLIATSRLLELQRKAYELEEQERGLENIIYLEPSKLPETVDAAEKLLARYSREHFLYQRAGKLVRITKIPFAPGGKKRTVMRPHDAVVIKEIDQAYLTVKLTKLGIFLRMNPHTQTISKTDCPEKISRYLLAKQEWSLPILTGIINTPTLRLDGTILDAPGYDAESGMFFVAGDCAYEKIPECPTSDDVEQAKNQLLRVIKDFPFENEVGKSVLLAAILTALIRKSLPTAPMFGFTAPTMSSGKSLLADVVALIATGKANSVIAQAENEAEEKKRLMAVLIEGDSIVCYDNVERDFGSAVLCAVLTQREYKDRLLGGNETRSVPTNATFLVTGNNLTFVGDISTRTLLCRLDPLVEHPEQREFDTNLHQYIPENRAQLVRAGLIILRAYHAAGRPKQNLKQFGRFEEWSDWVRASLVWIGLADPCESRKEIETADPVRIILGVLLTVWYEIFGDACVKIKEVVCAAQSNEELQEIIREFGGMAEV